jgi:CheY-like chemotaxis protein
VAKKVLILESDEFYIEVIGTFVRLFLQYDFLPTKSVSEASQAVQQAKPDMILVDLDTDGQPATEFTEKMRDDCDTKSIPIIAIAQDAGLRDKALGAGCNAFITKPFKIRELEALIGKLISS